MEDYVEAIEEGRIVRVSSDYAKREGLMILRKPLNLEPAEVRAAKSAGSGFTRTERAKKPMFEIDKFRRPLNYKENNVLSELVPNFHWQLSAARKAKNLTRRQVGIDLSEDEETIKMLENGILPKDDFVLINKIQNYFGLNLRKDGQNFSKPVETKEAPKVESKKESNDEIVIFEDEV